MIEATTPRARENCILYCNAWCVRASPGSKWGEQFTLNIIAVAGPVKSSPASAVSRWMTALSAKYVGSAKRSANSRNVGPFLLATPFPKISDHGENAADNNEKMHDYGEEDHLTRARAKPFQGSNYISICNIDAHRPSILLFFALSRRNFIAASLSAVQSVSQNWRRHSVESETSSVAL